MKFVDDDDDNDMLPITVVTLTFNITSTIGDQLDGFT